MHHTNQRDRRKELTFFDTQNSRALSALLPEPFARQIRNLWDGTDSELLGMSDVSLMRVLRKVGKVPTPLDHRLRMQFWFEYDRIQSEEFVDSKMNMSYVIGHAIAKESFYKFYITDPHRLAYMLCPPVEYVESLRAAITHSVFVLQEIMEQGLRSGPIEEFAPQALKIFESLWKKFEGVKSKAKIHEPEGADSDDEKVPEAPPVEPVSKEAKLAELEKLKSRIAVSVPEPDLDQV